MNEFEKEFIIRFLKIFKGDVKKTAIHMNVRPQLIYQRILEYNIDFERFKGY